MRIQVKPSQCRVWTLHARSEEHLSKDSCADLVESVRKHGQRHAVLGRKIAARDGVDFEVIYGARRLFVARQLEIDVLMDVRDIDDRSALIEMDVENRARSDISPYERGQNYARWLRAGHFKNQAELARGLGISEAQVSRLLKYSELSAAVVGAFRSVHDIREEWAVALANACRDSKVREDILRRARERSESSSELSPLRTFDTLLNGSRMSVVHYKERCEIVTGSTGEVLFRVANRSKAVHLILPRAKLAAATLRRITREISAILEECNASDAEECSALGARKSARKAPVVGTQPSASPSVSRAVGVV
jgi:ParB/RepB/Spo0J family partition protein